VEKYTGKRSRGLHAVTKLANLHLVSTALARGIVIKQ
jgi:hypothetical protein